MVNISHLLELLEKAKTQLRNFGAALDANPKLYSSEEQLDRIAKRFDLLRETVDSPHNRIDGLRRPNGDPHE